MVVFGESHRGIELSGRLVEVAAEEVDPAEHRLGVRPSSWIAFASGTVRLLG